MTRREIIMGITMEIILNRMKRTCQAGPPTKGGGGAGGAMPPPHFFATYAFLKLVKDVLNSL